MRHHAVSGEMSTIQFDASAVQCLRRIQQATGGDEVQAGHGGGEQAAGAAGQQRIVTRAA